MNISNFKLQIANCKRAKAAPACPYCLLPTPYSRSRRPGVSIIEVLFSILVTTVGLFGAIAVFPVASSQARRARTNDAVAAAGRSAVHTFDTIGIRRRENWRTWNASYQLAPITFDPNDWAQATASFCIDSRFLMNGNHIINATYAVVYPYNSNENISLGVGQVNTTGQFPRMHRVSFVGTRPFTSNNAQATLAGNKLLADSIFVLDDDLAFARPGLDEDVVYPGTTTKLANDRSLPAIQLFDQANGSLVKRQSHGHLSWMATLVPKVDLALGAASDEYTLSIVVFEDRPLTNNPTAVQSDDEGERVVSCRPMDDGSTGGEVRLTSSNIDRLKLRANDWVMLACNLNYSVGVQARTINRFQWYRVTSCDPEPEANGSNYELYATLIGPDWNWPAQNLVVDSQIAVLMPGVVAVHEKTIRLDKSF